MSLLHSGAEVSSRANKKSSFLKHIHLVYLQNTTIVTGHLEKRRRSATELPTHSSIVKNLHLIIKMRRETINFVVVYERPSRATQNLVMILNLRHTFPENRAQRFFSAGHQNITLRAGTFLGSSLIQNFVFVSRLL